MHASRAPFIRAFAVNAENEVISILRSTLNLPSTRALTAGTPLLGSIAELDSMAVVSILTALEERFGFAIDDDEVEGRTFESVGTLTRFVQDKLGA
jgi:acyl carrier protein